MNVCETVEPRYAFASSIAKQFFFENRIIVTPHSHPNVITLKVH